MILKNMQNMSIAMILCIGIPYAQAYDKPISDVFLQHFKIEIHQIVREEIKKELQEKLDDKKSELAKKIAQLETDSEKLWQTMICGCYVGTAMLTGIATILYIIHIHAKNSS